MSNDDYLYLITDLSEEEALKLFLGEESASLVIETFESSNRFVKWIEDDFYQIEAEKVPDYEQEWHREDFNFSSDLRLGVFYEDAFVVEAHRKILAKTARFLNKFSGDALLSYDYTFVLRRESGKLKLSKDIWTSELLDLFEQEFELIDSPNV